MSAVTFQRRASRHPAHSSWETRPCAQHAAHAINAHGASGSHPGLPGLPGGQYLGVRSRVITAACSPGARTERSVACAPAPSMCGRGSRRVAPARSAPAGAGRTPSPSQVHAQVRPHAAAFCGRWAAWAAGGAGSDGPPGPSQLALGGVAPSFNFAFLHLTAHFEPASAESDGKGGQKFRVGQASAEGPPSI